MISLQLVLEPLSDGRLSPVSGDLARALASTAPHDCSVLGILSSSARAHVKSIEESLPGVQLRVHKLPFAALKTAWRSGMIPARGVTHSATLLAPRASLEGGQTIVTLNNWPGSAEASRSLLQHTSRLTDAIIAPTSVHAELVREVAGGNSNVVVIAPGPRSAVANSIEIDATATNRIVIESADPQMVELSQPDADGFEVVEIGNSMALERRAELLSGALAYVPAVEGLGIEVLEALAAGAVVVAPDRAWAHELAGDAFVAAAGDTLADVIDAVSPAFTDPQLRARLRTAAIDRAKFFCWQSHAEQVWQLHADL